MSPLFSLQNVQLTFGARPLFTGLELYINPGDKICLIGRNGSGKSTLLKVIAGLIEPDEGERFVQPGTVISYMDQESNFDSYATLRDVLVEGLSTDETYKADMLIDDFEIKGELSPAKASGGEKKKVALAKALITQPDILLLDEPTNHLDLMTIEKLEKLIQEFSGSVVVISHDRQFLKNVSQETIWLDRGMTHQQDKGYADFDEWQEQILEQEQAEQEHLKLKIARETQWLHKGVTARRKRNMGRLRRLQELRQERKEQIKQTGSIDLTIKSDEILSKLVIEAKHLNKSFGDRTIVSDFSFRIMRGNKIGIVGANGVGKTTLIKLLTGKLDPDAGSIRIMRQLSEAYFDQNRATLNLTKTLKETLCPDGGDTVFVGETTKHVMSYLQDFLFTPDQANQPVSSLSGGEKNRLILAKTLATPSNFLVLDEPTNDLDMDTLDLLQEALMNYNGTVLIVSHDRDFLDHVATSLLYMAGDGSVMEYIGNVSELREYVRSKQVKIVQKQKQQPIEKKQEKQISNRISFKDKRLYDLLPGEIEQLECQISEIENQLNDPELYMKNSNLFAQLTSQLDVLKNQKDEKEMQWLELAEKIEQ
ncbi:MAG: ABC-F family ATP-binding cassette domain-containing protein [Alphaproteobacteria bacterium]|nr:ABC-F family ATP-binding cassette domain-containing protein [Alphaproteobacteria bacterium]